MAKTPKPKRTTKPRSVYQFLIVLPNRSSGMASIAGALVTTLETAGITSWSSKIWQPGNAGHFPAVWPGRVLSAGGCWRHIRLCGLPAGIIRPNAGKLPFRNVRNDVHCLMTIPATEVA